MLQERQFYMQGAHEFSNLYDASGHRRHKDAEFGFGTLNSSQTQFPSTSVVFDGQPFVIIVVVFVVVVVELVSVVLELVLFVTVVEFVLVVFVITVVPPPVALPIN